MAKIAAVLDDALAKRALEGGPGRLTARVLAEGREWSVSDVVCTSGPQDRPLEEQHDDMFISLVVAGSFQYRAAAGYDVLTPGSLMLGNAGQRFECRHDHGAGDRCLSFAYTPEYFERLAAAAGAGGDGHRFRVVRVPPLRALTPLVARACAALVAAGDMGWEELSLLVAAHAVQLTRGARPDPPTMQPVPFPPRFRTRYGRHAAPVCSENPAAQRGAAVVGGSREGGGRRVGQRLRRRLEL